MKSKSSTIRFLYAASDASADSLYLSGVFVPDPFLAFTVEKKSYAVVNQLEYGRVAKQSNFDEVLLLESVRTKASQEFQLAIQDIAAGELMLYFAQYFAVEKIEVPADFPAILYAKLRDTGYAIAIIADAFFPQRAQKSDAEARAIRQGNAASAAGIRAAEAVLRAAKIEGKRLIYQGRSLTSERLRTIIDQACLEKGATANNTIVAGGRQACDPHEAGHGPLRPHELIIIDVFPRVQKTGYHGDMTRTFLKGKASPAQRSLVQAVRQAHAAALEKVKSRVTGDTVDAAARAVFEAEGFVTERRKDGFVGFIHSTGHGLGLEVHEAPRVAKGAPPLKMGQVITIEPGLYYPEIGGCRIEDVVRVTKTGYEKLSQLHYRWELR